MLIAKPNTRAAGGGPCGSLSVFDIFDEDEKIGQTSLHVTDQRGIVLLRSRIHTVEPIIDQRSVGGFRALWGFFSKRGDNFALLDDARKSVATAETQRDVYMSHDGQSYILQREGFIKITWRLYRNTRGVTAHPWGAMHTGLPIGVVAKKKLFGRTVIVDLPSGMDEAVQIFLFWLRLKVEFEMQSNDAGGD